MSIDAVPRTKVVTDAGAAVAPNAARAAGPIVNTPGPYVQFEAFVLQNFIQSIMPQQASAVFGEGTAGEVWKSMLAEKIALQVAEAGGVGIAKMIAPNGRAAGTLPGGGGSMASATAAQLLDLQASAAQQLTTAMPVTGLTALSDNKTE